MDDTGCVVDRLRGRISRQAVKWRAAVGWLLLGVAATTGGIAWLARRMFDNLFGPEV